MTFIVRVKDRGRDLAVHRLDDANAADEIRLVYQLLGYVPEKIVIESSDMPKPEAA
ncbi:MAG: hypothetical protein NVSMB52_09450 [Chloroflexota bacterium]